jgi:hypothetical protein
MLQSCRDLTTKIARKGLNSITQSFCGGDELPCDDINISTMKKDALIRKMTIYNLKIKFSLPENNSS